MEALELKQLVSQFEIALQTLCGLIQYGSWIALAMPYWQYKAITFLFTQYR